MWPAARRGRRRTDSGRRAAEGRIAARQLAGADAESEFLIFSPSEQIAEVEAHMARRAQETDELLTVFLTGLEHEMQLQGAIRALACKGCRPVNGYRALNYSIE